MRGRAVQRLPAPWTLPGVAPTGQPAPTGPQMDTQGRAGPVPLGSLTSGADPGLMTPSARPPFHRYAAKFLIALAVAVVGSATTITAAVSDDHISTSEWATIVIALLTGIIGSGATFAVPNARAGQSEPAPR